MPPQEQVSTTSNLDPSVVNLAKAIRQTESNGNFQAKGKSGEFGAYQFTPKTWDTWSAKHLGKQIPLDQATPEQQNEVAYKQIKEWKDNGNNVGQIASMWNAGENHANAYQEDYRGTNAQGVRFDTPAYAKSVATAYQTLKQGGQVNTDPNNPSSIGNNYQAPQDQQEGFLSSLFRGITAPVATMIARPIQLGARLLGASNEEINKASAQVPFYGEKGALNVPETGSDFLKDVGRAGQTVALGLPVNTLKGAIGAGAVMGAGSGLENNPTLGGAVKGAAVGSALGLAGGGLAKTLEWLPKSLASSAFPNMNPSEIEQALVTKSIGTKTGLLSQSQSAIKDYGSQITNILKNTEAKGAGDFALRSTLQSFPEYATENGTQKLLQKIKNLIPSGADGFEGMNWNRGNIVNLIDKIGNGTANLEEKNLVRSAIDSSTAGGYARLAKAMNPSAGHDLAMTFADALRKEVQNSEPKTIPIFSEFAKEMTLKKGLSKLVRKPASSLITWRDLMPFMAGSAVGGPMTGVAATLGARAIENPAVQFGAAKTIQGVAKGLNPVLGRSGLLSPSINR